MFVKPTVEEFKIFFARDFPFQPTPDPDAVPPIVIDPSKYVQDSDIVKAFMMANTKFLECCLPDQESYTVAYMYLAAHVLSNNFKTSNGGMNGSFSFGSTSQSVGSVSISNSLPGDIATSPIWAWYISTPYGVEYVMMIYPCTLGAFGSVPGRTHA